MDYGKSAVARISYSLKVAVMFTTLILSTVCNWPPHCPTEDSSATALDGLRSAIKSLEHERGELEEKKADMIEANEYSASQLESLSSSYKSKAQELEMCQNNAIDVRIRSSKELPTYCDRFSRFRAPHAVVLDVTVIPMIIRQD